MSDLRAGLGPAIVSAVALIAVVHAELRPRDAGHEARTDSRRATPGVVALLDGLAVGERIAGWEVLQIDGPRDGVVYIELGRDHLIFPLMVARVGTLPELPPLQTERYAIYHGHAHPPDASIPDGALRAISHGIARRIRSTEGHLPVPAGM